MSVTWTVRYHVGTYSGTVDVTADENAESDHVKALARKKVERSCGGVGLPPGSESWTITDVTS